ncbi:tyrosine-type recombinase/integrase [Flavobacterium sp. TMP13]|uniref:tyrosine-type recombinase/integrase n=1 Tax=Flavobacterium sp. TMP13 TaxID=3425950 RepID=UPI003D785370
MIKLSLPKKSHKGLKIFCKVCLRDNPKCKHLDSQIYRVRVHVPGSAKRVKTKVLLSREYNDAVIEAVNFEKDLIARSYSSPVINSEEGNDYSIVDAVIKFNQYLDGANQYAHLKKNISQAYRDELIRYCTVFLKSLKEYKNIEIARINSITNSDISKFYVMAEKIYAPRTFNKCMNGVKFFFSFLIDIEDIEMKNPMRNYIAKVVLKSEVESITKEEFESILLAIDNYDPVKTLGGKGEKKNLFKPYLKAGFKLFLLTGGRREEVVDLRWDDIFITVNGVKFFKVGNLKVERIKKVKNVFKYIPINEDLNELLLEMGYNQKKDTNEYILFPDRDVTSRTIMDALSKAFTHYRKGAGISKEIGLKNLRKTYLSWVNHVMGDDTKVLSSHSTNGVLKEFYLDPKILSPIEEASIKIKIFG